MTIPAACRFSSRTPDWKGASVVKNGDWQAEALRQLTADVAEFGEMLERAVKLAGELPGAESAGISLVTGAEGIETVSATDDAARRADALQLEVGQGPLFHAVQQQVVVYLDDLEVEPRWTSWSGRVVAELGLRSMLTFQLFSRERTFGALSLYSRRVNGFDLDAVNDGYIFAAQLGVAVAMQRQRDNLRSAIASRTIIGQAEGILMERFGLDGDAAFNALKRVSQHRNVKVRDAAAELVDTRRLDGLQDGVEPQLEH